MNYDHNKKFGLLKFNSGYDNYYLNSPKDYIRKIINMQTDGQHKNHWVIPPVQQPLWRAAQGWGPPERTPPATSVWRCCRRFGSWSPPECWGNCRTPRTKAGSWGYYIIIYLHNNNNINNNTVKSFNFMGRKLCGLMTMDMFMDTLICGFQIICNITKVIKYFVGILKSKIALPTKNTKLYVQQIKMILPYLKIQRHVYGMIAGWSLANSYSCS